MLVYVIPPDERETAELRNIVDASTESLAQAELPCSKLKQVYWIFLKGYRKPIPALFDSGATTCADLIQKLKIPLKPSRLKAVATATGRTTPITASVDLELALDAMSFPLTANVLPSFLPSIQLIIGEDFMTKHNVTLSFGPSQCTLLSRSNRPVIITQSLADGRPQVATIHSHRVEEVESDDNEISAAMALRILKRKGLRPFVALIMPNPELSSNDEISETHNLSHVPLEHREVLKGMLEEFPDVFNESPHAGGANVEPLRNIIDLVPGYKPPFRKNYRLSPLEMQELKDQVEHLLAKGIITSSNSPFGAPVLFVP